MGLTWFHCLFDSLNWQSTHGVLHLSITFPMKKQGADAHADSVSAIVLLMLEDNAYKTSKDKILGLELALILVRITF